MKIGLFSDTYVPEINGVASSVATLANQLKKHGHTVYVITTRPNNMDYEEDPNIIRLDGIELKALYGYTLTSPIHPQLMQRISEWGLDLIHCHTEFSVGILGHTCAKYLNIPLVSTYHTTYEDYTHYVNPLDIKSIEQMGKKIVKVASKSFLKSSMAVISPSSKTKTMLLNYGVKAPIHIIPTGLDLKRFAKENVSDESIETLRHQYHLEDKKIILFVGRIAQEKSLDVVLDCFEQLVNSYPNYHLLIVGKGPGVGEIQAQIKRLAIGEHVTYCGPQPREILPTYYHLADLFVSASLTETQGVTFIEALAASTPILARKDDVLNDLLYDNETGYFFEDASSFVSAIKKYEALDETKKAKMHRQCLEVVNPYDDEVFYHNIIKVYESVCDHYLECYILSDVQPKGECMEITFENNMNHQRQILVTLEDYMNKGLRKGVLYTEDELDDLMHSEENAKAYKQVLRFITRKDRTIKETYDFLTQKTELDIEQINIIINRLENQGYLNDEKFVINYLYSMQAQFVGNEKIKRNLKQRGVNMDLIHHFVTDDIDEQFSKAMMFSKVTLLTFSDNLSLKMRQHKLQVKLYQAGFNKDVVEQVLATIDFSQDMLKESDSCIKTAEKGRKIYQKKYEGSSLRNKVFNYCLQQGFNYSDVYAAIDALDWEDYD